MKSITRALGLSLVGLVPVLFADITPPLLEGSTTVRGTEAKNTDLLLCDVGLGQPLALKGGATLSTDATGAFSTNLAVPLVSGQQIQLRKKPSSTSGCGSNDTANNVGAALTVAAVADWGRVHATFAAGTVLSTDNNFQGQTSSQASLFMDFSVDKNWKWAGVDDNATLDWHVDPNKPKHKQRWMINTFFETRLTSIPEAQKPTTNASSTTTGTGGTGGTTGTGGTAGTGGMSGTTGTTDTVSTFLASRKSALMQAGLYVPILVNKWRYQNAPNSLFLAPIAKIGFITPTESSATQTSAGTVATPVNPSRFYNYYGFGGRIGHYKLSFDKNEAPELISYIDVIFGRWSNLETLAPILVNGKPVVVNGVTQGYPVRRFRLGVEGALKVPSTPFLLGFSANIGQNLTLAPQLQAAKDDLRFFFGTKFDIGKLFAKLQQW